MLTVTQLAALLRQAGRHPASTPRPTESTPCRAASICISSRWSRTPSPVRLWPCYVTSTPPALTPRSWPATIESFDQHPDAHTITSMPGLGSLTGARMLAEVGDDRSRSADARALKAYTGSAPVTRGQSSASVRRTSPRYNDSPWSAKTRGRQAVSARDSVLRDSVGVVSLVARIRVRRYGHVWPKV
jgi:hypothetical protein